MNARAGRRWRANRYSQMVSLFTSMRLPKLLRRLHQGWRANRYSTMTSFFTARRLLLLLRRLHQAARHCRGLALSVAVVGAVIAIPASVAWEMRQTTITIEPILVPSRLNEAGHTSHTMAQRLLAEVNVIKDGAGTYMTVPSLDYRVAATGLPSTPDFVLPSLDISIRTTAAYLRRLIGRPNPVVTGEFSYDDDDLDTLRLHVRVDDRNTAQFADTIIDNLLQRAAAEVVRATEPFTLAAYLYSNDDAIQAEAVLADILTEAWSDPVALWALNLQGIMLDERQRYNEALIKYRRALTLDSDFPNAYHNIGNVLFAQNDYHSAICMYQKALEFDPPFAAASYRILGRAYIEIGDPVTAIAKYAMACELDSRLCEDMERRIAELMEESAAAR